ncbi:IFN-inducible and antiviral protein [Pelomyxa schiedti]|nr:IFN-inducible and antiviral protein [Pelomyxa schiedti]
MELTSVNFHFLRACNYACIFCFHTATREPTSPLSLTQCQRGIQKLYDAGTRKINFAGGEPFLRPDQLGAMCKFAHGLPARYGPYVDVLGLSIDSFRDPTNQALGRAEISPTGARNHRQGVIAAAQICKELGIKVKLNTVVCSLNHDENMADEIAQINPCRWKVFKVLVLENERCASNAAAVAITDDQFRAFVARNSPRPGDDGSVTGVAPIVEDNGTMQNSYVILDERMRFLDCSLGQKVPGPSILDVGVTDAFRAVKFDVHSFERRDGNWTADW